MKKNMEDRICEFQNPVAVIQAAVDLLNRDPDNIEKILMVCRIINHQAVKMSESIGEGFEESLEERLAVKA